MPSLRQVKREIPKAEKEDLHANWGESKYYNKNGKVFFTFTLSCTKRLTWLHKVQLNAEETFPA